MKTFLTLLAIFCAAPLCAYDTSATITLLPKGWDKKSPLPLVIWLHGRRADPTLLKEERWHQQAADKLGYAIVGIAATKRIAPDEYEWSGDMDADYAHIKAKLAEVEATYRVTFSQKMFFGFSQGAVLSAELAARHPDEFSGAIVLSPGCQFKIAVLPPSAAIAKQSYFISCGQKEEAGNLWFARYYAAQLRELGATTTLREVEGVSAHHRPSDLKDRFPEWATAIMGKKANPPREPAPTAVTPPAGQEAPATVAARL
jgi:predicted esterase